MLQNKKAYFSSSATVYGSAKAQPVSEESNLMPISTYGSTKFHQNIFFMIFPKNEIDVVALRYFNPVGSHSAYEIFEDPYNGSENLMPKLIQAAIDSTKTLKVFGNDYKTDDGTGERDYIHIEDLVDGHLSAIEYLKQFNGYDAINLGTGKSYSVLELISAFEKTNDIKINYEICDRRKGDVARCFSDVSKSKKL